MFLVITFCKSTVYINIYIYLYIYIFFLNTIPNARLSEKWEEESDYENFPRRKMW